MSSLKFIFFFSLSGQPVFQEGPRQWKDMLMAGICADGSCLPPIICTDDKKSPEVTFENGKVLRVTSSRAPSNDNMKRILDELQEYLQDGAYVLLDEHRSHRNVDVIDILKDWGATPLLFPPGTGKLLDPVDNSFNSALKTHYYEQDRTTHLNMLHAIYNSYYASDDADIVKYWKHIGYTTNQDIDVVVENLARVGYSHGSIAQKQQDHYLQIYAKWKDDTRQLQYEGIAPKHPPSAVMPCDLDGQYWCAYQVW